MAHIVKCRICKQQMDTDKMDKSEWIMPNPRCYYHSGCYKDWHTNKNNVKASGKDETFWYESLIDYLYRDIKMSMDFNKIYSQWNTFTRPERAMTPKGIYFSIRYYYDIMHGDASKSQGGIGIVPNIYKDAAMYWTDLEARRSGTLEEIIEQIKARKERPVQTIIKQEVPKKDKTRFKLEDI